MNPSSKSDIARTIESVVETIFDKGINRSLVDPTRVQYLRISSFPFCARSWFLAQPSARAKFREEKASSVYFTSVGTAVHNCFQGAAASLSLPKEHRVEDSDLAFLPKNGLLVQDWVCTNCKARVEFTPHPLRCEWCGETRFRGDEHEVKFSQRVLGHMDGTFAFPHAPKAKYSKMWIHIPIDYKGLALDTPLPTPTGWTTMGKVQVGDTLFDASGNPCKVLHKSAVHRRKCYRITFDDGSTVVCDDEHLWTTSYGKKAVRKTAVVDTEFIRSTVNDRHIIPLCGPLNLEEKELLIDPYVLGCWLGDGTAANGTITQQKSDWELFKHIEARGYKTYQPEYSKKYACPMRNVEGLNAQLAEEGLRDAKHIPEKYLRAGYSQRVALLQGLMDTDGSYNTLRQQAVFSTVDPVLAMDVKDLICGLGQRGVSISITAKGFGKTIEAFHVRFRPVNGFQPFRLTRKAKLVAPRGTEIRSTQRKIVSVDPIRAVKTQCIAVDSPDKTYLCTRSMIPTHNTCSAAAINAAGKLPYPENVDQLLSYGAIKQAEGFNIPAVALIYLCRDNPSKRKIVPLTLDGEKQRKKILKYEKSYLLAEKCRDVKTAMSLPVRATENLDKNCMYCKYKKACGEEQSGKPAYLESLVKQTLHNLKSLDEKSKFPNR